MKFPEMLIPANLSYLPIGNDCLLELREPWAQRRRLAPRTRTVTIEDFMQSAIHGLYRNAEIIRVRDPNTGIEYGGLLNLELRVHDDPTVKSIHCFFEIPKDKIKSRRFGRMEFWRKRLERSALLDTTIGDAPECREPVEARLLDDRKDFEEAIAALSSSPSADRRESDALQGRRSEAEPAFQGGADKLSSGEAAI